MNKITIPAFLAYFLGLTFLSFGVILAIKADYGVTVSTSLAYVFSLKYKFISFGTFNYLIQGFIFIFTVAILKNLKIKFLLSFITAVVFGYFIDLFNFLLKNFTANSHLLKVSVFALGLVFIGIGLAFFVKSSFPILPFDTFVKEVSSKYNINIGNFKTGFDICILTCSTIASFVFFGTLKGIGIGTAISAMTIGTLVRFFINVVNNKFNISHNQKFVTYIEKDIF